jgi:preprotein translocase subunit SecE
MWPSARSVRGNVTVVLLTVVMVVIGLGMLEQGSRSGDAARKE